MAAVRDMVVAVVVGDMAVVVAMVVGDMGDMAVVVVGDMAVVVAMVVGDMVEAVIVGDMAVVEVTTGEVAVVDMLHEEETEMNYPGERFVN